MCTRVCVHVCVCVFTPLLMFLSGILTSSSLILSSLYVRELALYLGPMLQIFCPVFHLSSEFDLQCLFAFLLRHLKKNYGAKFIDLWLILAVFRNPSPIYSWRGTYTCFLLVLAWFSSTPCLFFFFLTFMASWGQSTRWHLASHRPTPRWGVCGIPQALRGNWGKGKQMVN